MPRDQREQKVKLLLAMWFGNGHVMAPSRSRKGQYHAVDMDTRECACEDFQLNKVECWHLKELTPLMEQVR